MKPARWIPTLALGALLLVGAFILGRLTRAAGFGADFAVVREITYDASQYAPEAFEETNSHFEQALERGDYPRGVGLICVYPTGLGGLTIVVAGENIPEGAAHSIINDVERMLENYPRTSRIEVEGAPDQ